MPRLMRAPATAVCLALLLLRVHCASSYVVGNGPTAPHVHGSDGVSTTAAAQRPAAQRGAASEASTDWGVNPGVVFAVSLRGGPGSVRNELISALLATAAVNGTLMLMPRMYVAAGVQGTVLSVREQIERWELPVELRVWSLADLERGLEPAATLAAARPFALSWRPFGLHAAPPLCIDDVWEPLFPADVMSDRSTWYDHDGYSREEAFDAFADYFAADVQRGAAALRGGGDARSFRARCVHLQDMDRNAPTTLSMRAHPHAMAPRVAYFWSLFSPSSIVAPFIRTAEAGLLRMSALHAMDRGASVSKFPGTPWWTSGGRSVGNGAQHDYGCLHLNSHWCANQYALSMQIEAGMVRDATDCLRRFVVPAVLALNQTMNDNVGSSSPRLSTLLVVSQPASTMIDMIFEAAASLGITDDLPRLTTLDEVVPNLPGRSDPVCCGWAYFARGMTAIATCSDARVVLTTPSILGGDPTPPVIAVSSFGRSVVRAAHPPRLQLFDTLAHEWQHTDSETGFGTGLRPVVTDGSDWRIMLAPGQSPVTHYSSSVDAPSATDL